MPVIQDSGTANLAELSDASGPDVEVGLVRIYDEPGPWVISARVVWPSDYGPNVFIPLAERIPQAFIKVQEGRTRASDTWTYNRESLVYRDFAWQSSATSINVTTVGRRLGKTGNFARVTLSAWAVRGTLSRFELTTAATVHRSIANAQFAINTVGEDACIPRSASSCRLSLPFESDGIAVPSPINVIQLGPQGQVIGQTRVTAADVLKFIPLFPAARFVALVDPAGGVVPYQIPISWECHA